MSLRSFVLKHFFIIKQSAKTNTEYSLPASSDDDNTVLIIKSLLDHMIKLYQFVDMTLETLEERIKTQKMEGKIINKKLHDEDSF